MINISLDSSKTFSENRRIIEVISHNPDWKRKYREEASKIKVIFEEIFVDIYHIGSTAVPIIKAKPIIDILVEVSNINKVDSYNRSMGKLEYEALGEYGIPGRRFFQKGGNNRTHHVHIFQTENSEIKRHIAFRDYLISHPKVARKYSLLKEKLAEKYRYGIDKYQEGKDSFIKKIDRLAKK